MISHKHKCIFVEIPKTGCSSIRSVIGSPPKPHLNICQIKDSLRYGWTHYGGIKNKIFNCFYPLLPTKSRKLIGDRQFNSYFKFGFVRNPWDRVVSLYLRGEGLQMHHQMTFNEFVSWIKYSSSTCIHPVPHVNQLDWLVDPHGNVMVDFIGRFENFQKDWLIVSNKLRLPKVLPHRNRNPIKKKHYTEFYTESTKRIINQKFQCDIEYFGYRFGD